MDQMDQSTYQRRARRIYIEQACNLLPDSEMDSLMQENFNHFGITLPNPTFGRQGKINLILQLYDNLGYGDASSRTEFVDRLNVYVNSLGVQPGVIWAKVVQTLQLNPSGAVSSYPVSASSMNQPSYAVGARPVYVSPHQNGSNHGQPIVSNPSFQSQRFYPPRIRDSGPRSPGYVMPNSRSVTTYHDNSYGLEMNSRTAPINSHRHAIPSVRRNAPSFSGLRHVIRANNQTVMPQKTYTVRPRTTIPPPPVPPAPVPSIKHGIPVPQAPRFPPSQLMFLKDFNTSSQVKAQKIDMIRPAFYQPIEQLTCGFELTKHGKPVNNPFFGVLVKFTLPRDVQALIKNSRRSDYSWKLLVRFKTPSIGLNADAKPDNFFLKVNETVIHYPDHVQQNKKRTAKTIVSQPFDITPAVIVESQNTINFSFTPDTREYIMSLWVGKAQPLDEVVSAVQRHKRGLNMCKAFFISSLKPNEEAGEDEIQTTGEEKISMKCPVSKCRMTLPCRGIHCKHLQAFDGKLFLTMNKRKPNWRCFVCDKYIWVGLNELYIDTYVADLIEQYKNVDEVLLKISDDGQNVNIVPKEEEEDDGDYSDDDYGDGIPEQKPKDVKKKQAPVVYVISSSDEDEPRHPPPQAPSTSRSLANGVTNTIPTNSSLVSKESVPATNDRWKFPLPTISKHNDNLRDASRNSSVASSSSNTTHTSNSSKALTGQWRKTSNISVPPSEHNHNGSEKSFASSSNRKGNDPHKHLRNLLNNGDGKSVARNSASEDSQEEAQGNSINLRRRMVTRNMVRSSSNISRDNGVPVRAGNGKGKRVYLSDSSDEEWSREAVRKTRESSQTKKAPARSKRRPNLSRFLDDSSSPSEPDDPQDEDWDTGGAEVKTEKRRPMVYSKSPTKVVINKKILSSTTNMPDEAGPSRAESSSPEIIFLN